MNQQEFLAAIEKALVMDEGTLESTKVLTEIESWDSMAVLEFQAIADEEFGVQVDPTAIGNCETVGDLWNLIEGQVKAKE